MNLLILWAGVTWSIMSSILSVSGLSNCAVVEARVQELEASVCVYNSFIRFLLWLHSAKNTATSLVSNHYFKTLRYDANSVLVVSVNWRSICARKSIIRAFILVSKGILFPIPFCFRELIVAVGFFKIIRQ